MADNEKTLTIYMTIYNPSNPLTDFKKIIKNGTNQNKLFIYNDNFFQFQDKNSMTPGGGNACLRPYRQDTSNPHKEIFSLGIPTGPEPSSSMNPNDLIHEAIQNIKDFITNNSNIQEVYYSCEKGTDGNLGLNIFKDIPWSQENINLISQKLKIMFKELEKNRIVQYIINQ